ncbi:hypothetical protein JCGZ_15750 [Jatropha curcas]|uniref:Cytochrome P450 CYP749A22-like n=1 Tax=Jatropha curcas TaxID=180498 RepID=A0A067L2A0_JATCU|nr:hypothetical protein JCGZ_15750 [Jatropha curcas]
MRDESINSSMELSHQMFSRIQPHYYLWRKLHGKNYISWLGPRPRLVVTEPQLVKEILNNKDEMYPKPEFESYMIKLFGDGLVTTKVMITRVEMMLGRWRQYENKEIDVWKEFKQLTSDVISRTSFGSSYSEAQDIFDMIMELLILASQNSFEVRIPLIKKFIKTKDDIESDKLEQRLRESILKMIRKREEEAKMAEPDSHGSDFLGVLLKANQDPNKSNKISINDIVDEYKTFYIAGQETTSAALNWTIFLLAIHIDWQEKVRKEVLELFGRRNPTLNEINKLKIMNMVVNETLRLYAPVTNLLREVPKGSKLGKLLAPARMDILIPPLAVHHDPDIWGEDVHLFKPERFAEGVAKATKGNIGAFVPFSLGPRNCVGMNFAMTETKIALSMILQRYSFTLSPNYVHSPVVLIGVIPKKGLQITLQALEDQSS